MVGELRTPRDDGWKTEALALLEHHRGLIKRGLQYCPRCGLPIGDKGRERCGLSWSELARVADRIDSYCDHCDGDRRILTNAVDLPFEERIERCFDSIHAAADQVRGVGMTVTSAQDRDAP